MQCTFPSYTHTPHRDILNVLLLQTSTEMCREQMCERRKGGRFSMHHRSFSHDQAKAACHKRTKGRATFSPLCLDASSKWARRVARPHSPKWHVSIRLTPLNVKVAEITGHFDVWRCGRAAPPAAAGLSSQNLLTQIDFSAYSGACKHLRAAGRIIFLSIVVFLFVDEHLVEGIFCNFQMFSWIGQERF